MPVPLNYPLETIVSREDFSSPRSPPLPPPPRYYPPVFEKVDMTTPENVNAKWFWMSDTIRNHLVSMIGEFLGTTFFLFFALGASQVAAGKADNLPATTAAFTGGSSLLQILYISFSFGVALAMNVWVFFRVSGGMFNPAVTLGLCLAGALPWMKIVLLVPMQLLGGILAAFIVDALFPGDLLAKLQTTLGSGTTNTQGVFIEMLLTSQLIFTILMLAVEKHRATPLAPIGIGMALFADHLVGINFTGAGMNPARTLGPAVILGSFVTYQWIYWLGPALGALLAVSIYKILKWMEYQTANPGQDHDGLDTYRIVSKRRRGSTESFSSNKPFASHGARFTEP